MEEARHSSTLPSIFKEFSMYAPKLKLKGAGSPDHEGAEILTTVTKRRHTHEQLLAMQTRLARLTKEEAKAQKAIKATIKQSEYILKQRRMKQETMELKTKHREALQAAEISNRTKIRQYRQQHKRRLDSMLADVRGRNFSVAERQRKLSYNKQRELERSMEADLDRKAKRRAELTATLESFKEGQKQGFSQLETSLKEDFNRRLMTEQQLIEDMGRRMGELEQEERSLLEKLSATQLLQKEEARKLQHLAANTPSPDPLVASPDGISVVR
jgi:hypothetical protein